MSSGNDECVNPDCPGVEKPLQVGRCGHTLCSGCLSRSSSSIDCPRCGAALRKRQYTPLRPPSDVLSPQEILSSYMRLANLKRAREALVDSRAHNSLSE